jgi:hypothetical protein
MFNIQWLLGGCCGNNEVGDILKECKLFAKLAHNRENVNF